MKKFTAAFLSLTLLLSIAGCDAKEDKKKKDKDTEETKKKQELTIDIDDDIKDPGTVIETLPEEQPPVDVPLEMDNIDFELDFGSDNTWRTNESYTTPQYTLMYDTIEITDDRFPALKTAISNIEADKINYLNNYYENLIATNSVDSDGNGGAYNWIEVCRADTNVYSYISHSSTYSYRNGTSDNMSSFAGININPVTGETIPLSDIVTDMDGFTQSVISILQNDYSDRALKANAAETFKSMLTSDKVAVAILLDGVHISFDPENILENSYTSLDFKVPYVGNESCLNSTLFTSLPDSYILEFPRSGSMEWDINNDGTLEKIDLVITAESRYDYSYFGVRVNDANESGFDNWALGYKAKLVNDGGKFYVYIIGEEENGYCYLMVFSIGVDGTSCVGEMESAAPVILLNPNRMVFSRKVDCLSTMTGYLTYTIGNDGMPNATSNYFRLNCSVNLTTKVALTGQRVSPETMDVINESADIEPGTTLHYVGSDNESFVDFLVLNGAEEGSILRFEVTLEWSNGGQTINGISGNDAFTATMYAG